MRTARVLIVCPSMLCTGGCTWSRGVPGPGVYLVGGVPGLGGQGCTWSWGCTWSEGCTWSWGVPGPGGCTWSRGCTWSPGGYLVQGGVPGPGGCTWSWGSGVPGPRGVPGWGVCSEGGVPGLRGVPGLGVVYLVQGVYFVQGGVVYLVRGCTWSRGVYMVPGGYLVPGGCTWSRGVPGPGGTCSRGVPGPRGVYLVPGGVRYSPREQNDKQVQKYYLAPNFVCGR